MIIYGWNSKNLKQAHLENFECPSCQQKNSVLAIFSHYAHIFWIPFFPYKKSAIVQCTSCQFTTQEKEMTPEMKAQMKQLKSAVSTPKYLFSGLIILAVGIGFIMYSSNKTVREERSYIENPQIGDVYIIKDVEEEGEYNHFLYRVNDIVNDSLYVAVSSFYYNGVVYQLDPKDGFYNFSFPIHKDKIKDYENSGELKHTFRDYNKYTTGFDRTVEFPGLDSLIVE